MAIFDDKAFNNALRMNRITVKLILACRRRSPRRREEMLVKAARLTNAVEDYFMGALL